MINNKSNNNNVEISEKSFRIEVSENEFPKLYLHGTFTDVKEHSLLVSELINLNKNYSAIEVWISSYGGGTDLMFEIVQVLRLFDRLITICNSTAASAAANIWSIGDVRVASPSTSLVWHRESYDFSGKTPDHETALNHMKSVFPKFLSECISGILSEEETALLNYSDVYKDGDSLIESGSAISFRDYIDLHSEMTGRFVEVGRIVEDKKTGRFLMIDDSPMPFATSVIIDESRFSYSLFDSIYNSNVEVYDEEDEETFTMTTDQLEALEEGFRGEVMSMDDFDPNVGEED